MTFKISRSIGTIILLSLLSSGIISGCSGNAGSAVGDSEPAMASMDGMPSEVRSAPPAVQQAYQFAAANPEVLSQIPCYCGCGSMGHTSNYSCYVQSVDGNGDIQYDTHALGCSICVDITLDTIRLLKQGKSAAEIKAFVDQTYARFGPSNIP